MARYRKKPVEVEAYHMGSEEPMPDWARAAAHCRALPSGDCCWLVRETFGGHQDVYVFYPFEFEQRYEVADKPYYQEVYEWAFSRMEGCDEPEFTMFDEICGAIAKYRQEVVE